MQRTFEFQHLLPLLSNARHTAIFAPKSHLLGSFVTLSRRLQTRNSIVCAGKGKRRRSGFRLTNKSVLKLVSVVAVNFRGISPPLDLAIEVLCGGDGGGGGSGIWGGFGGGFEGWGRRGKKKLGLGFFLFLGVCGLVLLLFGRGSESALLWKAWWASAIGAVLMILSRWIKICFLGLCCFGVLVVLGMKKEDQQKWVERIRDCSPVMEVVLERKSISSRRRRRRSW